MTERYKDIHSKRKKYVKKDRTDNKIRTKENNTYAYKNFTTTQV